MKIDNKIVVLLMIISLMMLVACDNSSENNENTINTPLQSTSIPESTSAQTASPTSTLAPTPVPDPVVEEVILENKASNVGNYNSSFSHYDFNVAYDGKYVRIISWDTMYIHGSDVNLEPTKIDGFTSRAIEPKFYNGKLYYLVFSDDSNQAYYLYSWDYENTPEKVTEQMVYTYIILDNEIYFMEEFYQGPLYAFDLTSNETRVVSTNSAMSFSTDGNDLYFKSSSVGTAPGIVKINSVTKEESIVVFPFYDNNYIIHDGYIYYESSVGNTINISKQSLADGSNMIIKELNDYAVSLNISDGILFYQTENYIKSCNLDGSNTVVIYEGNGELKRGTYIIGDRIYFRDYDNYYMIKKDSSDMVILDIIN